MAVTEASSAGSISDRAKTAESANLDATRIRSKSASDTRSDSLDDLDRMASARSLRLLRTTAILLLAFEVLYFAFERYSAGPLAPLSLALHASAIGLAALLLATARSGWFERHRRLAIFATTVAIFGLTLALRLIDGDSAVLFLTVALGLVATAAFAPWSAAWQTATNLAAVATIAISVLFSRPGDDQQIYRFVGVLIAAILGHLIVAMRERDRAELKTWAERLYTSHHELADALTHSARVIAEREAAEGKLRKVLEASGDAISINRLRDGVYLDVNRAFCEVTGYEREEVIGRSALELGVWADPEQLRHFLRLLRGERRVLNLECSYRMKGGRAADHLVSASLIELDGQTCIVGATRDVTGLKRTEHELRAAREMLAAQVTELRRTEDVLRAQIAERETAERRARDSEQTLRKIFETGLDAMVVNRWPNLTFVDLNERHIEVFGIARERALSAPPGAFRLWARPEQFRRYREEMNARGFVRDMEVEFILRDGGRGPFLCSSALIDLNGQRCAVSTLRDISRLKRNERELIAARETALNASETKSHFLSVMSHEIRTPMNAIFGMADMLWETPLNAEQRRYVETVRRNSATLLRLVNDILDLSRVESGRLVLDYVDFDLLELAEDVIETLAVRAHEKGLELVLLMLPRAAPTALSGDPLRLRQILMNLVGNAIKFTERGEVSLTIEAAAGGDDGAAATRERQALRFSVRDTGIGIPAGQQETIFASFTQADSSITRRHGGSGLGLAIVKRLVDLMGGTITIESAPGAGSVFSVVLTLDVQPLAAGAPPSAVPRLAGKRVLVADRSDAGRAMLAELVDLTGARATTVVDAESATAELARARAQGRPYDAVIADHRMRPLDEAGCAPREPMLLTLTASDANARPARLSDRGMNQWPNCRYVLKPVRRADLWSALAAACAQPGGEEYSNGAAAYDTTRRQGSGDARSASGAAGLADRRLRILLAEDSPDNRLLIEAYLRNTPYQLECVDNGEAAVNSFATRHYDVILMDIEMPVMDGYEATAEIRRRERGDHRRPTPIIALTASAEDAAARRSLKSGCQTHLIKPVKRSDVLEAIRKAVEPEQPPTADAAQPIVVEVDEYLSDLIPGFLARKREDARAAAEAAERDDFEKLARLGHKIKGEGGSFGLETVSDLGREIEQAGKSRDRDAARRLSGALVDYLARLSVVYRRSDDL